ncbi:MAG: helical backbone metal receptor [Victivallaceae bacterium]|nr:helical backbone metal receptor [Victivallaceae bacterium]
MSARKNSLCRMAATRLSCRKFRLVIPLFLWLSCCLTFSVRGETGKSAVRIVSLSPCLTEIIFKLGKGGAMVGRSTACDYPGEVENIPVAGRFGVPFLEKLLVRKVDVVVASSLVDRSMKDKIQSMGVKFRLLPTESINDYFNAVKRLGEILGCEDRAEAEIDRVRKGLAKYRDELGRLPERGRPSVYLEVWNHPMMTVGKKSFINDYITYAGGRNIAGAVDRGYFACSAELVLTSRPQVIIAPSMGKNRAGEIRERNCWADIPAVKNNRIYVNLNSNLIFRLGPRILESIELLRKCIRNPDEKIQNDRKTGKSENV